MTTFSDWCSHFTAYLLSLPTTDRSTLEARYRNLLDEKRLGGAHLLFTSSLVTAFDAVVTSGVHPQEAAAESLESTVQEYAASGKLEFLIHAGRRHDRVYHYATARKILQFGGIGDFDRDDPPATFRVTSGLLYDGTDKRVIWVTPDDVPNDPDELAQRLGLPHFSNDFVLEFQLDVSDVDAFVPTCFDAGLYEAWMIGPVAEQRVHGRTRHTQTGQRMHRELVVDLQTAQGGFSDATFIPSGATPTRVAPMNPDYMVGR
ncbi:hypothetical protein [Aureimonas phyllosphaerae]|uniref:Uncharacterized protein n=1 Tax=Aureimonas phyllosphaerae TaxID=1166078 RepID=A0A7W6C0N4_9HYPH|nr:hypothetical protein [Aureimonas phyllosphaerae]MBB3937241.1 hypothetical protein [Aureimonas phyllosphaerae]MBB3961122.1 hypothetical protein [Aureimonas phyllosphaerae]SFF49303.1 hypothetical protein SAMN05216566_11769 [Aureimonas phyllosphaerae]